MKKTNAISIAALLAFFACTGTSPDSLGEKTYPLDSLSFDFRIEREIPTRGVRSSWEEDDRIFVFFSGVSSAYITLTYDGSDWGAPSLTGDTPSLGQSGMLTAIYLPYGNGLTPEWDSSAGAWTVGGETDFYFLRAEKATYYITDMENEISSLGSYLYMENADDFVQFYIPDESASGSVSFASNALYPSGFGGVSLDGSVQDWTGSIGGWINARADTIDGETGYYASGKLYPRAGVYYYFALDAAGSYRHYYKQRDAAITGHRAFQLPGITSWPETGEDVQVEIAGNYWLSVNAGAADPWQAGSAYTAAGTDSALPPETMVPTDAEWDRLISRYDAAWVQISIAGTEGYVVVDRFTPENYFFLPSGDYWSGSQSEGVSHYFRADTDGTLGIYDSDPPSTAKVRPMSSNYHGGFNPPENGGEI